MILILSYSSDPHADRVESILRQQGMAFRRVDTSEFPAAQQLAMRFDPQVNSRVGPCCELANVDLSEVTAIWYRRPGSPTSGLMSQNDAVREYVVDESIAVLDDLWNTLPCSWFPGDPHELQRAKHKALQLRVAAEVGLEIPPTLITNDPRKARDFYCDHGGKVISKLASGAFHEADFANTVRRYTEPVTHRDLGYLDAVRHCPILFQAYIPKQFELRCTVVDGQVFSAAIHSQQSRRTRHDWRRYDRSRTPYLRHELPSHIAEQLITLVRRLKMRYGAIDLIYTQDGRYVFVEINPNGQFLFVEEATGLPISVAVADALSEPQPSVYQVTSTCEGIRHDTRPPVCLA